MTLFEYLAIAFSLVYSFSAMRFVAGVRRHQQRESSAAPGEAPR